MSNIIIIKINAFMRPKELNDFSQYVRDSMKTGLIILPSYCDIHIVPEESEVRIDNSIGSHVKGEERCH